MMKRVTMKTEQQQKDLKRVEKPKEKTEYLKEWQRVQQTLEKYKRDKRSLEIAKPDNWKNYC